MGCVSSTKTKEQETATNLHDQNQVNSKRMNNDEKEFDHDVTKTNHSNDNKSKPQEEMNNYLKSMEEIATSQVNFEENASQLITQLSIRRIATLPKRVGMHHNASSLSANTGSNDNDNATTGLIESHSQDSIIPRIGLTKQLSTHNVLDGIEYDTYDMSAISNRDKYDILCSAITPRPIVFISTIDTKTNVKNLAPMSFAAPVTADPPSVMISITTLRSKERRFKDTLLNIRQNGEFVVNHLTKDFFKQAYDASEEFPPEIDEFDKTGLTPLKSDKIEPFRVKESPMQMECKAIKIVDINGENYGGSYVVFGEVVATHVRTDLKVNDEKINEQMVQTVSRLGALRYGTAKVDFEMNKGTWTKDNW